MKNRHCPAFRICREDCGDCAHSIKYNKLYGKINRQKAQKAEIERLKAENSELRLKMSYMKDPNTIGDIHEMGAW